MRIRVGSLIYCIFTLLGITERSPAKLTIAQRRTPSATLMYNSKPMFKVEPLPEVAVFLPAFGSTSFNVEEWPDG